jgi:hypothetical protein
MLPLTTASFSYQIQHRLSPDQAVHESADRAPVRRLARPSDLLPIGWRTSRSLCGASITIVSGCSRKRKDVRYGCSMHYNRGRGACSNNLLIARRELERQLLAGLQEKALNPDVVAYTLGRFEAELKSALDARRENAEADRRQAVVLEKKIGNLTAALAEGFRSPAVLSELVRLEAELAEIRRAATVSNPEAVTRRVHDTRRFVESRLKDLQALFGAEAAIVRAEIAKHVQQITLTPEGRTYVASGTWNVLGAWQHGWCRGPESNWLRPPFQGGALPMSYPGA